jgi:hypothetical protein
MMANIVNQADALLNEIQALADRQRAERLIDNQQIILARCNECYRFISRNWERFDNNNKLRIKSKMLEMMQEMANIARAMQNLNATNGL